MIVNPKGPRKTPKRLTQSIRRDPIDPKDYAKYTMPWACEDCTHFEHEKIECTIGYKPKWHLRKQQEHDYNLSGRAALCRFQEID